MIIDKMRTLENLTVSERAITDYILKNINNLHGLTTEKLAQETFTSKATVSRLCKKLGLKNYYEFKQCILQEREEWLRIQSADSEEPVNQKSSFEDIMNTVPVLYDSAIRQAKLSLDKPKIIRIFEKLKRAEKIDIYGTGLMYQAAQVTSFKFMNLGKECSAYDGLNEHYVIADRNRKNKVVFVLSMTGNNLNMIRIAGLLKDRGFYVVGIGGTETAELKKCCTEYIEVRVIRELRNLDVLVYFTSILYVLDVLFVMMMTNDYEYNVLRAIDVEKSRKNETNEAK